MEGDFDDVDCQFFACFFAALLLLIGLAALVGSRVLAYSYSLVHGRAKRQARPTANAASSHAAA